MFNKFILILCLFLNGIFVKGSPSLENWTGRWFPERPTEPPQQGHDVRVPMGILNPECDDGKSHLEVDWLDDPSEHSCYDDRTAYKLSRKTKPLYEVQDIPPAYMAAHSCMNMSIEYDDALPTFGTHRPLWPVWGEYVYVPVQRWLHNLEHGGVVMLYHPCVDPAEVDKLRSLVNQCLYRHVITPSATLTAERPLALLTWGRRLQMSAISKKVVVNFIKEAALKGPEHIARDGQYSHRLITHSKIVTDETDSILCPNF